MTDQTRLLATASDHAARGWRVFPLWPNTKIPAVAAWEQAATTDPATITRWWSARPYNIGIAVGSAGLFVIDLDAAKPAPPRSVRTAATSATTATTQVNAVADRRPVADRSATKIHGRNTLTALCREHGQPIPAATYIVATPSGGWHVYFQHPAGGPALRNTKGGTARSLGPLVDTRGHGGYVVAAGSVLAGRRYTVVRDLAPMCLPEWLTGLLHSLDQAAPTATGPVQPVRMLAGTDRRRAYLDAAIAREVDHVRRAPADRGNAALWGAAVALGQFVAGGQLDAGHVTDVLEQAATQSGRRSPAEARATIASGLRRGTQRPRTVTP